MKRILYLCVMMTLSMNMMAQIDLNDQNWNRVEISGPFEVQQGGEFTVIIQECPE